ncbi:MAG: nuclear transport factor 2 family protein [Candidatus Azotimanducaceae bacterium WSBS_2022_MAG_OTU7]
MNSIDPAVIEFANDNFYLAFNSQNMTGMSDLWAVDSHCVCIHPGWAPILGREEVLESWGNIFSGPDPGIQIVCHNPRVLAQGELFSVICYEQLSAGWLVATNNFVIEAGNVRMVHHQASHCMEPPELDEPPAVLQ